MVQSEDGEATTPEGVVAVAEIGVSRAAQRVHEQVQDLVPRSAKRRDVMATAAWDEPGPFGEIRSRLDECLNESSRRGTEWLELRTLGS